MIVISRTQGRARRPHSAVLSIQNSVRLVDVQDMGTRRRRGLAVHLHAKRCLDAGRQSIGVSGVW